MAGVLTQEQFPCPPGNLPWSVADIIGPSSYTQVTTGSPLSGGQTLTPGQLGLSVSVIWAQTTGSDDGQYDCVVLMGPPFPGGTGATAGSGSTAGITLKWIVAATGAEVSAATNLSGRVVRVLAIGR